MVLEQAALELLSQGLCHPRADFSYKLLKSHVSVEDLTECWAVFVLLFFWAGFLEAIAAGRGGHNCLSCR